jgi:predicted phage terminase large subunit-like protein
MTPSTLSTPASSRPTASPKPSRLQKLEAVRVLRARERDEARRRSAAALPTPGALAKRLDFRMIETEALELLDEHLRKVHDGSLDRLIWTMPPQEGKSQRVSRSFPLWLLLHNPELRIAIVSYEAGIARRWGRAIRNDIWSHPELGLSVRRDTSAAQEWQLEGHQGGVVTVGIGGALTGRPVDVMIIDDPVKGRAEADSETYRENAWAWWTEVGATRLGPGSSVVLLMTRWHEDDLAGRLLASESAEEWTHINIPALADHKPEEGESDPLGREPGTWLRSARLRTRRMWERIRRQVGARGFNALYQGRPSPGEGAVFKREHIVFYEEPRCVQMPDGAWRALGVDSVITSWDMAFKDTDGSDFVCGQVWGRRGADCFLLDQVYDRLDFTSTCQATEALHHKWPQSIAILVEDKANGPAVINTLRRKVPGLIPITPVDSKLARAHAVSPLFEARNVHLPHPSLAPWIGDYVEELCSFPRASHDDRVDATTQALARFYVHFAETDEYMSELAASKGGG